MITKKCQSCLSEFDTDQNHVVYCSRECAEYGEAEPLVYWYNDLYNVTYFTKAEPTRVYDDGIHNGEYRDFEDAVVARMYFLTQVEEHFGQDFLLWAAY